MALVFVALLSRWLLDPVPEVRRTHPPLIYLTRAVLYLYHFIRTHDPCHKVLNGIASEKPKP